MAQSSSKLSIEKSVAFGSACISTGSQTERDPLPAETFSTSVSLYRDSLILHLPSRLMSEAEIALHDFCVSVHLWVALAFLLTTGMKLPLALTPVLSQAY